MLKTLQQIKDANEGAGLKWFSPGAMRYFRSRVSGKVYPVENGALFVTSEQLVSASFSRARKYSVHFCSDDGAIQTVGKFQAYRTLREAQQQAKKLAATWKEEDTDHA